MDRQTCAAIEIALGSIVSEFEKRAQFGAAGQQMASGAAQGAAASGPQGILGSTVGRLGRGFMGMLRGAGRQATAQKRLQAAKGQLKSLGQPKMTQSDLPAARAKAPSPWGGAGKSPTSKPSSGGAAQLSSRMFQR